MQNQLNKRLTLIDITDKMIYKCSNRNLKIYKLY